MRLLSRHGLSIIVLLAVLILLGLTPSVIYAFSNGENASKVIGQTSFTTATAALTQNGLQHPVGVAFDSNGNLWVADRANSRVLEYSPPFSDGMNAVLVIGQTSFTTSTFATTQNGLQHPVGIAFGSSGNLWVADAFNNRVLEYSPPFSDGMNAALVIGQTSFTTTTAATTQNGLDFPRGVAFDSHGNLWVAEYLNNRVLEFSPPFSNGMNAAFVIGQTTFTTNTAATTQNGLIDPEGVVFDSHGNLWVADADNGNNNRVLEFPAKLPTSTKVTCTPNPVASGSATTCTATVTDTGGGTSVTPTGTVAWTSSLAGSFSSTSCTLSGGGSSASCSVMFTPSATGTATITAKYAGNTGLAGSKSTSKVKVT